MKVALFVALCFTTAPTWADIFDQIEEGWHAKDPDALAALCAEKVIWEGYINTRDQVRDHWAYLINKHGRNALSVHSARWHGRVGVADTWDSGERGYMILVLDKSGKIAHIRHGLAKHGGYSYAAETGQAADVASTVAGIAAGGAEANPLMAGAIDAGGLPLFAALKIGMTQYFKHHPDFETCVSGSEQSSRLGYAAAAFNAGNLVTPGAGFVTGVAAYAGTKNWAQNSAELGCLPAELRQ